YSIYETFEEAGDLLVENHTNTSLKVVNYSDNSNGKAYFKAPYGDLGSGDYKLRFFLDVYDQRDWVNGSLILELNKTTTFEIEISKKAFAFLPFVDNSESKDIRITDAGARPCWSVQDLGDWAYLLMGAELGGGRETAMLTGGAAGVPAWWMAFISLSLSVISLLILYPIMYKVYHQDTDDILSRNHIEQLVRQIVESSSHRMHINIDWDLFKIQIRELSVDILIAYQNTEGTLSDSKDVRAEILREILDEFALFRVFKPVQLTVKLIGQSKLIDFDSGVGIGAVEEESGDQDYSSFFSELHSLSRIEDDVRDSLDLFFTRRTDLSMKGAIVTSDDKIVFVSVIYRPMQRFAFFRFKKTSDDIKDELYAFISNRNDDILGSQELVVKTRNEISTLADRSGAGRIERRTTNQDDDRLVAVAKQDGLGGRMLQTKFLGYTLSTVEYMANEKREMINKWGFWGLIVFVWIPFMASGVLVGAMLGLLSRMKFMRVLAATFVGGAAASITWAYTAEGIVKFMHNYKLEAVIPIMIIVFILMAVLHIRSTKMRRQTELFEDTLLDNFQADITAKYGDQ
ncbi:MAG: small multi-drug export protein, partial [archaeon]|nr:small multi-drug export protein [archaeon]